MRLEASVAGAPPLKSDVRARHGDNLSVQAHASGIRLTELPLRFARNGGAVHRSVQFVLVCGCKENALICSLSMSGLRRPGEE